MERRKDGRYAKDRGRYKGWILLRSLSRQRCILLLIFHRRPRNCHRPLFPDENLNGLLPCENVILNFIPNYSCLSLDILCEKYYRLRLYYYVIFSFYVIYFYRLPTYSFAIRFLLFSRFCIFYMNILCTVTDGYFSGITCLISCNKDT